MFQPNVLFSHYPYYSIFRKGNAAFALILNSSGLAEGEGATATSLGDLAIIACRLIHRVPSIEGATATSLGIFCVAQRYIKINRKNAPNGLSLRFD